MPRAMNRGQGARELGRREPELLAAQPLRELPGGVLVAAVLGDADRPHAAHRRLPHRLRHQRVAELAGHGGAVRVLQRLRGRRPLDRHGRLARLHRLEDVGGGVAAGVRRRVLQELQIDLGALPAGRRVDAALPLGRHQLGALRPHGHEHVEAGLDVAARRDRDAVLLLGGVGEGLRGGQELVPGRRGFHPLLVEEVLPVDEELHVRVDRKRVLDALERARRQRRRHEVRQVVAPGALGERQEELGEGSDPGLVHEHGVVARGRAERQQLLLVEIPDGRHVELDLDAGLLLELRQVRPEHVLLEPGQHRERDGLGLRPRRPLRDEERGDDQGQDQDEP